MQLPQRLKYLRLQKNLTQLELANRLQLNRCTYTHYELGKREPDLATLIRIASYYDVSTDYLLGITELSPAVNTLSRFVRLPSEEYPPLSEYGTERVAEGGPSADSKPEKPTRAPTRRELDGRSHR